MKRSFVITLPLLATLLTGCTSEPVDKKDVSLEENKEIEAKTESRWNKDSIKLNKGYVSVYYTNTRKKIEDYKPQGQFITFKVIAKNYDETIKDIDSYKLQLAGKEFEAIGYKALPQDANEHINKGDSFEKIMIWFDIPKSSNAQSSQLYYLDKNEQVHIWHK